MSQYQFTPQATGDLFEIWNFIDAEDRRTNRRNLVYPAVVRFLPERLLWYINSSALRIAVAAESVWFSRVAPMDAVTDTRVAPCATDDCAIRSRQRSARSPKTIACTSGINTINSSPPKRPTRSTVRRLCTRVSATAFSTASPTS